MIRFLPALALIVSTPAMAAIDFPVTPPFTRFAEWSAPQVEAYQASVVAITVASACQDIPDFADADADRSSIQSLADAGFSNEDAAVVVRFINDNLDHDFRVSDATVCYAVLGP